MRWNFWIRQAHRWVSMVFTIVVAGIFVALGLGRELAEWVFYLPLPPLFLLLASGLYLFALPYFIRARRGAEVG
jgi:hypothetical protein